MSHVSNDVNTMISSDICWVGSCPIHVTEQITIVRGYQTFIAYCGDTPINNVFKVPLIVLQFYNIEARLIQL